MYLVSCILYKSKLSDGKTIGGKGVSPKARSSRLQRYYGLDIQQNTSTKPNPTQAEIAVASLKYEDLQLSFHPSKQH
jgi:hypothetical protein